MKYAIINKDEVINVINWDGITSFQYPFEHTEIIQSDELQIGMINNNGVWEQKIVEHILDVTE